MTRILIIALAVTSACDGNPLRSTRCDPARVELTGDLQTDIVGTYGSLGIDSLVYWVFQDDGVWRSVEDPNQYAFNGLQYDGSWELEEDVVIQYFRSGEERLRFGVEVNDSAIRIDWDPYDDEDASETIPRVQCRGYGF